MNMWLKRARTRFSTRPRIRIYHNLQFPPEDIFGVLYPLFGHFYAPKEFMTMINSTNHIFCAYDERLGQCVACALVNIVSNKGGLYLLLFGVRQTSQGQGVGTDLLQGIIRWARQTGHTFIYLHVCVENQPAIRLYEKVGFRKHQYLPNYYGDMPKGTPDAFRMILLLN